ncbi:MAG: hypothetical protein JXA93_06655, partial [Anaerolineae bacterium]|nr:hypothetical protein [Anaerolineae bacterium]
YSEPPLVVDRDLTLAGGYHSAHPYGCLTLTGVGYTTYRRSGTTVAPAIMVQNAALTMTWFIVELNAYGSGVQVVDGEATLENVIVRDNDATWGGGVRAIRSRVTLRDSEVRDNTADFGGGLHAAYDSTVVAEATLFRANQGWELGAGVSLHAGSTFTGLDGTSIESNVTPFGCDYGGGIYAAGAGTEVLLDASQVVSNTALLQGGGIYLTGGAAATLKNMARAGENRAFGPASGAGGGVLVMGAGTALTLDRGVIIENWADPVGGGIASFGGTVHVVDSIVATNSTRSAGGGIYNEGGELYIVGSSFIDNEVTEGDGGAVHSTGLDGTLAIETTWMILNSAPASDGAGLYASHPLVTVERSSFTNNAALSDGSAIYLTGACCPGASAHLVNNALVDNPQWSPVRAGPPAGGSTLYVEEMEAVLVHNTVVLQAPLATFGVYAGPDAVLALTNNIISNFYIGIRRPSTGTGSAVADYTLYSGNTYDYDPGLVSTHEIHGDPAFAYAGDFHITAGSAALDSGTATAVGIDFDGALRPWGPGPDIGADEYPPRRSFYLPVVHKGQ